MSYCANILEKGTEISSLVFITVSKEFLIPLILSLHIVENPKQTIYFIN